MSAESILQDKLVLVVDDDPDVRDSVVAAFRGVGANTIQCGDGRSAVKLTHDQKPKMVILDMMLPGQSGFLVLEKIKGYEDAPLVIMITANEGKRHKSYAEGMGADLYLQKPVSLEQLVESAESLLTHHEAEEQEATTPHD